MSFMLDSSVALAWLLREGNAYADELLERLVDDLPTSPVALGRASGRIEANEAAQIVRCRAHDPHHQQDHQQRGDA